MGSIVQPRGEDLWFGTTAGGVSRYDGRTSVCFSLAELDLSTHTFRLCNAACPYPYHFHSKTDKVNDLQVEAYPLGVRSDTTYDVVEKSAQRKWSIER